MACTEKDPHRTGCAVTPPTDPLEVRRTGEPDVQELQIGPVEGTATRPTTTPA